MDINTSRWSYKDGSSVMISSDHRYLHSLLGAVSPGQSERALHHHCMLGDGAQELFAVTRLRVILPKLWKERKPKMPQIHKHATRLAGSLQSKLTIVVNAARASFSWVIAFL